MYVWRRGWCWWEGGEGWWWRCFPLIMFSFTTALLCLADTCRSGLNFISWQRKCEAAALHNGERERGGEGGCSGLTKKKKKMRERGRAGDSGFSIRDYAGLLPL